MKNSPLIGNHFIISIYFFILPSAVPPPRAISAVIARFTLRSAFPYLQLLFDVAMFIALLAPTLFSLSYVNALQ